MTTYRLAPTPRQLILVEGLPANGAKIHTYAAGSTTPVFTYANSTGTMNTNPIVAADDGTYVAYLPINVAYKFVWTESDGTPIYEQDNIEVGEPQSAGELMPDYTPITSNHNAAANELVAAVSGSPTVTLPDASDNPNAAIWVVNNSTGTVTVGKTGTDTVGLATSQTLNPGATTSLQGDSMCFISDGISNWNIV